MFSLSASDSQALTRLAQDLVRTPSLSGDEGRVAAIVAEAMRGAGFSQVWTDRIGNVIGRYGPGGATPVLLFDGHMDTIDVGDPGAWARPPFGGIIEGGVLYGRGAVDMKGALAAMIYGVKQLADRGVTLGGDLVLACVVQEEPSEGLAARVLIEEEGLCPDFVILGEPTGLGLYLGQRGRVELQISAYGRAGHSATPDQGVNAIYAAARVAFGVELLATQLLSDSVLGQGSVTVTHIESTAGSRNAIPDRCVMVVDRRLTLGETEARAISEIQQITKREGVRADVATAEFTAVSYNGYTAHGRKYYPPWLLPEDAPLVRGAAKAIERALGTRARLGVWPFSTDGAYTMGVAGIPTIGFGPGEERYAHTSAEQVRLADLSLAARTYAQLAADLLGTR